MYAELTLLNAAKINGPTLQAIDLNLLGNFEKDLTPDSEPCGNVVNEEDREKEGDQTEDEEGGETDEEDESVSTTSTDSFIHRPGFRIWEVTEDLVDGKLDEDRMKRLKQGFLTFLA